MKTFSHSRLLSLVSLVLVVGFFGATSAQCAQAPANKAKMDDNNAAPYRITRGDVISVAVFGEPDLTIGDKKIEMRGTVNLPLIQDIRLVGLTLAEAKLAIETAYRDGRFLRNPEVTVSIETYAERMVQVTGQVRQPARYPLPPNEQLTLMALILKAQGFTDTARGTEVKVTRTLPDGTLSTHILDVESFMRGKSNAKPEEANFPLQADDIVYVPQRIF